MSKLSVLGTTVTLALALGACGDDVPPKRIEALGGSGGSGGTGGTGVPDAGDDAAPPPPDLAADGPAPGDVPSDAPFACPVASFLRPLEAAVLTAVNDSDNDGCANGFKYDVQIAAAAPNNTPVALLVGTQQVATGVVTGAIAQFAKVQIGQGANTLTVRFANVIACDVKVNVTVDCNVPTCTITKPAVPATRSALNGIAAPTGDRTSSPGSDYQVAFEVATTIEDGQPVRLDILRVGSPAVTTVTANAAGGIASFLGVTLRPDGDFQVTATCTSKANVVSKSTQSQFAVNTDEPALTVTSPIDGKFFGPDELANGKFSVCAKTASADAVGLPPTAFNGGKNLDVAIGTSTPVSEAIVTAAADTCVAVTCPGGAPFDLNVTIKDRAGNATSKKITGVSCASALPAVQIVSPLGDTSPFADVSKHLLAASSAQAFKDNDPSAGAQADVIVCSDKVNSKARLFAGIATATLGPIGAEVPAVAAAANECPTGYGAVFKFLKVTLPESVTASAGTLLTATRLQVSVTDESTAVGQSPPVDLWVDPVAPSLTESTPFPLCGSLIQNAGDAATQVRLVSTSGTATLTVTSSSGAQQYQPVTFLSGFLDFGNVTFKQGDNTVVGTVTEPSGNLGSLKSPCSVRVGQSPLVTWQAPAAAANLCGVGSTGAGCLADADGNAAGWQGSLKVGVTVGGALATTGTVTFSLGGTALGTAPIGAGVAQLDGVSIPDGASVTIDAVTSDISGTGTGSASRTAIVDTVAPPAPSSFLVEEKERRATTFLAKWKAPADSGGALSSYLVKVSRTTLNDANFDAGETVTFGGTPGAAGSDQSLDVPNRTIEREYYFAVQAVDAAGNRSTAATFGPLAARFNRTLIPTPATPVANERFGYIVDGSTDLNGDGRSDLVVGSFAGPRAYIFLGKADFTTPSTPIIITGPSAARFGRAIAVVGDIDGDTFPEIAIGASANNTVYLFKGRQNWNTAGYTLPSSDAYTIDYSGTLPGSFFGDAVARVGDFNNDGTEDFAVGAPSYSGGLGRVLVFPGGSTFNASTLPVATIDGPAVASAFGSRLLGLGRFYAGGGTTLLASAPNATGAAASTGRIYSFRGPGSGSFTASSALHFAEGSSANARLGNSLSLVGPIGGSLAVAAASLNASGYVNLYSGGSSTTGPFGGTTTVLTNPAAVSFGASLIGGGFSGTSVATNYVGDSAVDLVALGVSENSGVSVVYLLDGSKVASLGGAADIRSPTADAIQLGLPADWKTVPNQVLGAIKDLNGDGYGDFAVGEILANTDSRVAVFW